MKRRLTMLLLGSSTAFLMACGGGGGGTATTTVVDPSIPLVPDASLTNPNPTPSDFSWSTSTPNTASTISGIGQTAGTVLEGTDNVITALSTSVVGGASLSVTYDGTTNTATASSPIIEAAGVRTNASEFVGTYEQGSRFERDQFKTSSGASGTAGIVNPFLAGWDYQTFGLWNQQSATNSARGAIGAISVGLGPTAPPTGDAVYEGFAYGYAFESGAVKEVVSNMRAVTNVTDRSIRFSTDSSFTPPIAGQPIFTPSPANDFNLTGTLSYDTDTNQITGSVSSAGGLNGNLTGRFYGPAAEEIGGTFDLGTDVNRFIGGFGGKR